MAKVQARTTDLTFASFSSEADVDYVLARHIATLGVRFQARAGYLAHQACEKYLKALSVAAKSQYLETHNLQKLAEFISDRYPAFKGSEFLKDLEVFDVFAEVGRYGANSKFDPMSAGRPILGFKAHPSDSLEISGAWIWTQDHIPILDNLVFNMRGHLPFSGIGPDDALLAILLENKNNGLVGSWTGPVSIKSVLSTNNERFNDAAAKVTVAEAGGDKSKPPAT